MKPTTASQHLDKKQLVMVATRRIHPKTGNARRDFDPEEIKALAQTMMPPVGIIQPLTVRPVHPKKSNPTKDEFEVVAGSRRLEAAKFINLKEVPVIIRQDLQGNKGQVSSDLLSLVENLARKDLSAIEMGKGLIALKRLMQSELNEWLQVALTHDGVVNTRPGGVPPRVAGRFYARLLKEEPPQWAVAGIERAAKGDKRPVITWGDIAGFVGFSKVYVDKLTSIANMAEDVQDRVDEARLPQSVQREIAAAPHPADQRRLATMAIKHGASVRELSRARVQFKSQRVAQNSGVIEASEEEVVTRGCSMVEGDAILRDYAALHKRARIVFDAESEWWRDQMRAGTQKMVKLTKQTSRATNNEKARAQ